MNESATLRDLFERVLELPAAQRRDFLLTHCPDQGMRAHIERLLDADTDHNDPLASLSMPDIADALGDTPTPTWQPDQRIGEWTLQEHLGEGGSATVFRAIRMVEGTVQQAAIKLLHRGLHSPEAQRQFRRERQALAALDHPNIAHLLDGGVTGQGTAYLVITYVDGTPITDHARAAQLTLGDRLRMMVVVCRAVAAAHRNLIVHRDLKPANILVSSDGSVKLLDFGIAKLLDAGDSPQPDATRTGYTLLTPGYAAPEQHLGGVISTATDVYALGVVLHELLLGERPDLDHPTRPSVRAAELPAEPGRVPISRSQLRAALRGDLDNIILKALSEEPERRYAGADQLADDIERHLAAQPIRAHPPSRWYRTRKFVQRHRGGVVVTLALLTAILSASAIALWQAAEARHESRRANAMRDFMIDAFSQAAPGSPRDGPPRITDVVQEAIAQARADTKLEPGVRIELLTHLGVVLREQGALAEATDVLDWTLARAAQDFGKNNPQAQSVELELLRTQVNAQGIAEARTRADDLLARIPHDRDELRAPALVQSATIAIRQRDYARALREGRIALDIAQRIGQSQLLGDALSGYSQAQFYNDDFAGAAQTSEAFLALRQSELGPQHWRVAMAHANLSRIYAASGDLDTAERHARAALAIDDVVLKPDDWRRALHLNALLMVHRQRNDYVSALTAAEETLRINRIAQGDDNPNTLNALANVGFLLMALERYGDALPFLREANAGYDKRLGPLHYLSARSRSGAGMALGLSEDSDAGLAQMRAAIADYQAMPRPEHDGLAEACEKFARATLALKRAQEGAAMPECIDQALAGLSRPDKHWLGRADLLRAELALERNDPRAAIQHLDDAASAVNQSGVDAILRTDWALLHAIASRALGDSDAAAEHLADGRERLAAIQYPPSRLVERARTPPGDGRD